MPGVTQVSQVAREQKHLDDAITWLAVFPELGKRHQHTMREHDRLLSSPEHILNEGIHTFPKFLTSIPLEDSKFPELLEQRRDECPLFSDKRCEGHSQDGFIFWPMMKKLCRGSSQFRPADKDKATKCQLMQQEGDAYLKLGPFKLEHLNTDGNYVAEVHDIISDAERRWIMRTAKSNLKATPYTVNNIQQDFSLEEQQGALSE